MFARLYEEHHRLKISDEALKSAANLAARYVTDRFMPDKAIDLIDEASSRVRMQKSVAPPTPTRTHWPDSSRSSVSSKRRWRVRNSRSRPSSAIANRSCAIRIDDQEQELRDNKRKKRSTSPKRTSLRSSRCGPVFPVYRIAGEESERLLKMEEALHERIIGQEEAITKRSPRPSDEPALGSRIRSDRSVPSSSSDRPVLVRLCSPRRSPSSCSARKIT